MAKPIEEGKPLIEIFFYLIVFFMVFYAVYKFLVDELKIFKKKNTYSQPKKKNTKKYKAIVEILDSKELDLIGCTVSVGLKGSNVEGFKKSERLEANEEINQKFEILIEDDSQSVLQVIAKKGNTILGQLEINTKQHRNQTFDKWLNWNKKGKVHVRLSVLEEGKGSGSNVIRETSFFQKAINLEERDYVVILDQSGSMEATEGNSTRWKIAQYACGTLAPFVCKADRDGITLYLFNHTFKKFENVKNAEAVNKIFLREQPSGTTNLAGVLKDAFNSHFKGSKPTTILVITDGVPDNEQHVKTAIIAASNKLKRDADLSITFIQIGDDRSATRFLQHLDDDLTCKFDIVDTVTYEEFNGLSFDALIEKSIND